jgi:hypothetical protein
MKKVKTKLLWIESISLAILATILSEIDLLDIKKYSNRHAARLGSLAKTSRLKQ